MAAELLFCDFMLCISAFDI